MWWVWTIVLHGLVGTGAYWVARYGFGQPPGLPRTISAALLAWSWAILGVLVTGLLGILGRPTLLLWSLALLGAGSALRFRHQSPSGAPVHESPPAFRLGLTLALGLLLWGAAWLGMQSLLWPVKVVSDGPIYHLYFAARWWKAGRVFLIPTPFGENAAPYFPANGDLWFTWLITSWGGDRLARVGQAPWLVLAGLASFALAKRLGAGVSAAMVATAWFLSCTPLFLFSFEANVDTIFVAAYLVACYFFLEYSLGNGKPQALGLGALAAGGALGTKTTGVVFVPPLLALAALAVCWKQPPGRGRWAHLAIVVLAPLVLGGFWFARNAWLTGNPLYPLELASDGQTILPGWYGPDVMRFSQYYLPRSDWGSALDILLAVLDARLAPFWILALLGVWAIGKRVVSADRWVFTAAALAALNFALYWLLIPYRTQQRFVLHALGLAALPLARWLDQSRWLRAAAVGLLAVHMLTPQTWPFGFSEREIPWDLNPRIPNAVGALIPLAETLHGPSRMEAKAQTVGLLLAMGAASIAVAYAWGRVGGNRWRGRAMVAAAATVGLLAGTGMVLYPWDVPAYRQFYPTSFPDYYRGWLSLERLSGPRGSRVAYAGTNLPYYLMASGLRNEVRYINIDSHAGWLLHDYHSEAMAQGQPTWPHPRPGWDRIHPDYKAWLANLRAQRIGLLVVARANPQEGPYNVADFQGFPIERQWAEGHPEVFTPLYGVAEADPQFRIYGLKPAEALVREDVTDSIARRHK